MPSWMALLGILLGQSASTPVVEGPDYLREIKPILTRRCVACHGVLQQKSGLRVDTASGLKAGGLSGPAVELGKPDESYLIEMLTGEAGVRMPPEGEPLSETEIGAFREWIAAGAVAPADEPGQEDPRSHWAFRPPSKTPLPRVADSGWVRNAVDSWIAAARDGRGLSPVGEADRATLLRRVSLDLTGLAPGVEEIRAFEGDERPDGYERVVDRLLTSPAYGERWGRHWLDVWRYSDWDGFGQEIRESQPHIWRWRDWVVESLNAGMAYDRMVSAMIAGDEIAPDDPGTVRATGYLARNWYKFNRNVWLDSTVEHTGKAFLGLTFNCARCHDHKYDPIAQEDYYRLRAVFEPYEVRTDLVAGEAEGLARVYDAKAEEPTYLFHRGDEKDPAKERPLTAGIPAVLGGLPEVAAVELPAAAYVMSLREEVRSPKRTHADAMVEEARRQVEAALKVVVEAAPGSVEAERAGLARDAAVAHLTATLAERASIEARIEADAARFGVVSDSKRAEIASYRASEVERRAGLLRAEATILQKRLTVADAEKKAASGDVEASGILGGLRKSLDEAIAARMQAGANAARVSRDYASISDVYPATSTGRRRALAAWITDRGNPLTARVAVNHLWMRHFGRPLVETVFNFGTNGARPSHPELLDWLAVEFMESGWDLKHLQRLLVTSSTYRMESSGGEGASASEAVDQENRMYWRMNSRRLEAELVRDNVLLASGRLDRVMGGSDLEPEKGFEVARRSLYFRHAKEKRVLFLKLFDSANATSCYRRDVSVVPQQALALANSGLAIGEARRLAGAIGVESDEGFIEAAFERVLGRSPRGEEREACAAYLQVESVRLGATQGWVAFAEGPEPLVGPADDPRQRARENLVLVLFNHHDFVTIR